jgi:hypothetical protein
MLELLLGCSLEQMSLDVVQRLVDERQAEDQVLDFKLTGYAKDDLEAAKDVAAMANAHGGLLLLGVAENASRANKIKPVDVSDGEKTRLYRLIGRHLDPQVRDLWIESLPDESGTHGVLMIAVPASEDAPHGVFTGEKSTWWPIRRGTSTGYMREAELAARFRQRDIRADVRDETLGRVHHEGVGRLNTQVQAFLALSAVPERVGHWRTDKSSSREWLRTQLQNIFSGGISPDQSVLTGRRRVMHSGEYDFRGSSSNWHLEYHQDGGSFGALAVSHLPPPPLRRGEPAYVPVHRETLEHHAVLQLMLAAAHAARAGAGGDLLVTAQLVGIVSGTQVTWQRDDNTATTLEDIPLGIAEPHPFFEFARVVGSITLLQPTAVTETVPMAVLTGTTDLLSSASLIVRELLAEFNASDRVLLLPDGTLSEEGVAATSHRGEVLLNWSRANLDKT